MSYPPRDLRGKDWSPYSQSDPHRYWDDRGGQWEDPRFVSYPSCFPDFIRSPYKDKRYPYPPHSHPHSAYPPHSPVVHPPHYGQSRNNYDTHPMHSSFDKRSSHEHPEYYGNTDLRASQQDLRVSQQDLRASQSDLRMSQPDLRLSQSQDYNDSESRSNIRHSYGRHYRKFFFILFFFFSFFTY